MISGVIISTIPGNGSAGYSGDGGAATGAQLNGPSAIAIDPAGEVLIADTRNHVIRQVFRGGISTLAGNGVAGYGGDNRSAVTSSLNSPVSVSLDKAGRIYITDSGNNLIRGLNIYCNYSFSPSSLSVSAAGGTAKVTVQTDSGCSWTISNLPDWVTYSGPAIVTGTATATFSVTPHPGDARSATISIAGLPVTITQAACAYSFSPAGQVFAASGGSATVSIVTSPGCSWTVVPGAPWISLTSPASGTGNGSFAFTVAPDSAGRTAAITLGSASFTVQQLAAAAPGLFINMELNKPMALLASAEVVSALLAMP